jgi:hypothetical protein
VGEDAVDVGEVDRHRDRPRLTGLEQVAELAEPGGRADEAVQQPGVVARRGRAVPGGSVVHGQLRGREQPGVVDQPAEQDAAHVRHRF